MAFSLYEASIPVFQRGLDNLQVVLDKGSAFAKKRDITPDRLLPQRLILDMFPLVRQVQIACDTATRSAARLAGTHLRAFPDTETTMVQLQERVSAAQAYLGKFGAAQIDGREDLPLDIQLGPHALSFTGQSYLLEYALPNFYFHCTTAYSILRVNGVAVGKHDYLGI